MPIFGQKIFLINERKMKKKSLIIVLGKGGSLIVPSIDIFKKLMIIFYLAIASKFYYKLTEFLISYSKDA